MDLSTTYLGLELPHPFMPGSSPLALDTVRRLEDVGAAAIVMRSLFEEQITGERPAASRFANAAVESRDGAISHAPDPLDFKLGPHEYLEQLRRIKESVDLPVIASLNGTTSGGWLEFAGAVEEAGADAIELNVYHVATDPQDTSEIVESRILEIVRTVVRELEIPVAVKLSPFFTALTHLARRIDETGAKGIVLFNRFYQPDIDPEEYEVMPVVHLSDSAELNLRLRWLAILSQRIVAHLAVTGGVHTSIDAIKAVIAGADAVQMVSALLRNGPEHLRTVREGMVRWMTEREYESIGQIHGSMDLLRCPDPREFERGNYLRVLQSWRGFVWP